MQKMDFEHTAVVKHHAAGDFVPAKPERPPSRAVPASFVEPGVLGGGRRKRSNPFQDASQPTVKRVKFENQDEAARSNLRSNAPNQNPAIHRIPDAGVEETKHGETIDEQEARQNTRKRKAPFRNIRGPSKKANTSNAPGQIQDSRLRSMYQTPSRPKQGVKRKGAASGAGSAPKRGKTTKGAAVAAARNDMADRAEDAIRRHRQGRRRFDVNLSGQKRRMPQQEGSRKKADNRIPLFY